MFYVKHGEDQVTMLNSKCQTVILMNFIKKTLGIAHDTQIDLLPITTDPKLLAPLGVAEKGDGTYANTYLNLRANYVACTVKEDEDGAKEWTLQWKAKTDERDKIAAALDTRSAEEKKKVAASKGKGAKK